MNRRLMLRSGLALAALPLATVPLLAACRPAEDCDADDLAEGDPDCDEDSSSKKRKKKKR